MKKITLAFITIFAISALLVACTGMAKPTVGHVPAGWHKSDEASYGTFVEDDGTKWGVIEYVDSDDGDMVQIYYGDIPPELEGNETNGNALIGRAVLESTSFYPDETGTMTVAGHLAGYTKAYDAQYDVYYEEIVFILGNSCIDIYTFYDANASDEAQVMALINSIGSSGQEAGEEEEEEEEEETSIVTKPTVGSIPSGWFFNDEYSYGSFVEDDGTVWGAIEYIDSDDGDIVQIYYGDIPPELEGNETNGNALIARAVLESVTFDPTETGTMTVAGHLAGYAKAYDSQYDVYDLEIVFILGSTCIDIYAFYDANSSDEAQVMLLINSIR